MEKILFAFIIGMIIFSVQAKEIKESGEKETASAAQDGTSRQILERARALRKILNSKKIDETAWWKKHFKIESDVQPIREPSDSFYRWSGVQILSMAFGGDGGRGIEPIPQDLSNELLDYLKNKGFSNYYLGSVIAHKWRSNDLRDVGIYEVEVDEFISNFIEGKRKIVHISFFMEYFNFMGSAVSVIDAMSMDHRESLSAAKKPSVNYSRLAVESNDYFAVIGQPTSVLDTRICLPEEILLAKCVPSLGSFKVDYFYVGN